MKKRARRREANMQLIQIGPPQPQKMVSIREMFEQLAQKEAEMIREARERALERMRAEI
jgi:hypothetical protein